MADFMELFDSSLLFKLDTESHNFYAKRKHINFNGTGLFNRTLLKRQLKIQEKLELVRLVNSTVLN